MKSFSRLAESLADEGDAECAAQFGQMAAGVDYRAASLLERVAYSHPDPNGLIANVLGGVPPAAPYQVVPVGIAPAPVAPPPPVKCTVNSMLHPPTARLERRTHFFRRPPDSWHRQSDHLPSVEVRHAVRDRSALAPSAHRTIPPWHAHKHVSQQWRIIREHKI